MRRPAFHRSCAHVLEVVHTNRRCQPDSQETSPQQMLCRLWYTIFACIALIGSHSLLEHFYSSLAAKLDCYNPVFWLESGSVLAFAIAWLVKGETFSFIRD